MKVIVGFIQKLMFCYAGPLFRGLVLVLNGRRNSDLSIDTAQSFTVGWRSQFALDGLGVFFNFDIRPLDLRQVNLLNLLATPFHYQGVIESLFHK